MYGLTVKSDESDTVTLYSNDRFLRDAWVDTINMAARTREHGMNINDRCVFVCKCSSAMAHGSLAPF